MNGRSLQAEEILVGQRRKRLRLLSPEGLLLDARLAGHMERLTAFTLDMLFLSLTCLLLYALIIPLLRSDLNISNTSIGLSLILFASFIVRNLYFIHFELAWEGRTPGKKICGLRVISRRGGELAPSAIIARNLTREVEIFLPLTLCLKLFFTPGIWQQLAVLGWVLLISALPLLTRDRLRAGDLIGGTQVIAMPRRLLLEDLTLEQNERAASSQAAPGVYAFTPEQLDIYGVFELQILEEFLRRPENADSERALADVSARICRKIGWNEAVAPTECRRFLKAFYAAEREKLERARLFGQNKEKQDSAGAPPL